MRSRDEIRAYAKDKGVKLVDVAGIIGVSRQRLANIMRESMNGMWEKKIVDAIDLVYAKETKPFHERTSEERVKMAKHEQRYECAENDNCIRIIMKDEGTVQEIDEILFGSTWAPSAGWLVIGLEDLRMALEKVGYKIEKDK